MSSNFSKCLTLAPSCSTGSGTQRIATMLISSLLHSRLSMRSLPRIDHRILIVAVVLVVFGSIALIGFLIYVTKRLRKRRPHFGPYEGTVVHPADLAAQITPFGGSGPHRGRNMPRFSEFILYCNIFLSVLMTSYSAYPWRGHANCPS